MNDLHKSHARVWGFAIGVGVATAIVLAPGTTRAQEGTCVAAQCQCPDGSWVDVSCGTDSCYEACGGQSSSSGSGGGGLIGGLLDWLFTPSPPDPEAEARAAAAAAEAARLRAEELAQAEAEYVASRDARLARELRGRDVERAWGELETALQASRQGSVTRDEALRLMVPIPKRDKAPAGALAQAACANFHLQLADAMGARSTQLFGSAALDMERIAFEASAPFDRGEVVGGCEGAAAVEGPALPNAPANLTAVGTEIRTVWPELRPAAERLAQAAAAQREAERKLAEADLRVKRQLTAIDELTTTMRDMKKKVDELKQKERELADKLRQPRRAGDHERFDAFIAEQGYVHEHLPLFQTELDKKNAEARAETQKLEQQKADAETDRKLYEAGLRIYEGERDKLEALRARMQAARAALDAAAGRPKFRGIPGAP